ncbi:DNA polymerase Y family protein [Erysipelothrix aquatica]|uniref:DNA polymerase Y family protein n=2 Tax=Erysipelothrix aquatica TaxID=2683714 RepID=UPI001F29E264|nr:DNA polymerase IV [Erysipelothrix aquatica]
MTGHKMRWMMEKERIIFHIDINHCFAQIEEMLDPSLKDIPMCVGGDEEKRSGIVLARNLKAKEYGITTAETLRDAYRKCPHLRVVPAKYSEYIYYTSRVKDIYREYTNQVESYGLDEAWIDVTDSYHLFGKPYDLAYEMQKRVLEEYGLTVSVGVAWNKVFAKLGSDMIKPSGMVIITKYNYQDIVWNQPVEDLLFVGGKTKPKLNDMGIFTIGDLAQSNKSKLQKRFGVKGIEMWNFANGYDNAAVDANGYVAPPKSIGNSTTPPSDINSLREAEVILQHLCESVASRLRDEQKKGHVVSIYPRDTNLKSFSRQRKLQEPTNISTEILKVAMELLEDNYDFSILPLRSIGVHVSKLVDDVNIPKQINLFDSIEQEKTRELTIDKTIDELRERFGFHVVKRASALLDKETENFDAKNSNSVFPGRKKDYDLDNDNIENDILYKKDKRSQKIMEEYLKNKGEY